MRLSDCLGEPVLAADGTSLGRLHDLAADPTVAAPVVTAIEIRRRRQSQLGPPPHTVQLRDGGATPGRELAPSELLLRRDVLDGQVVDVAGAAAGASCSGPSMPPARRSGPQRSGTTSSGTGHLWTRPMATLPRTEALMVDRP